jgi:hypothetical protein
MAHVPNTHFLVHVSLRATRTYGGSAPHPAKFRTLALCWPAEARLRNSTALWERVGTVTISLMIVYDMYQFPPVHFKFAVQSLMNLVPFGWNTMVSDANVVIRSSVL